MFHVVFCILLLVIICKLGSVTSVGEERATCNLSAIVLTCNYVVSVRRCFLFLLSLGWAALFYCGTPWAFHIIILGIVEMTQLGNSEGMMKT